MHARWIGFGLVTAALVAAVSPGLVAERAPYTLRVVARGLARPTGITVDWKDSVYFTEVPTPGTAGGANAVKKLDLDSGTISLIHQGEPEPVNISVDRDGELYWTCRTAGVILTQGEDDADASVFADQLSSPTGIVVGRRGAVYFTEVPTPGVPGSIGGRNTVSVVTPWDKRVLHTGDPEPTDVAVNRHGTLYWTCKSAGVILVRRHGETSVLLEGLREPSGIALDRKGEKLYFTEVPTPGVPGSAGGGNKVSVLDLRSNRVTVINAGDPEPTDIAVNDKGDVYWTCTSAGVIVEAKLNRGRR